MTDSHLSPAAQTALDVWLQATRRLSAEERARVAAIVGASGPPEPSGDDYRSREARAIDRILKQVQDREAVSRDRAGAAGRRGVAECRQAGVEALAEARRRVRERTQARQASRR